MSLFNKSLITATLLTSIHANKSLLIEPTVTKYESATDCLLRIAENDFRSKSTILLYRQEDIKSDESERFFDAIMGKLIKVSIPSIVTADLRKLIETDYIFLEKIICLMYFENCEQLLQFQYKLIHESIIFIIVINNYSEDSCRYSLSKIGDATCEYHVSFLTINLAETQHKILTFLPEINSTSCKIKSNLKPIQVNKCFHNIIENRNIFPDKSTRNLHKCPLNVGLANLKPYTVLTNDTYTKNMQPIRKITGSDYEIVKIIVDYLNATLRLYYIQTRFENGTADSTFIDLLKNNSLDICAGGLFRDYGTEVTYSGVYSWQAVVWAYTVERTSKSWKDFINKSNGFYIFFLFYMLHSFIWYLCSKFDKQKVSFDRFLLRSWGMLLGAAYLQNIRSTKQKIVNGVFLIMCVHLASYVNIQLYSFLTINEPPPILKTNEDVMTSGRPVFPGVRANNLVKDDRFKAFFNQSKYCSFFHDCADETWRAGGATVLLDAQFIRFQLMTASQTEARVMRPMDPVITLFHEMPVSKDTIVLEYFRRVMTRLNEAGILNRLFNEALGLRNISKAQQLTKAMMSNSYSCTKGCSIKIDQIAGWFYVWLLGCSVSCLVLIAEIVANFYKKNVQNVRLYLKIK